MTDSIATTSVKTDRKLCDEPGRLAALRRYDVLDTPAEEAFDKLTDLLRTILKAPMCAVTLVDSQRQWFKSRPGLGVDETPRCVSFCAHAIAGREPLIIEDVKADPRFRDNPLVLGEPFIGSYAGVPLCTPDGYNVGALCAIDTVARTFDATQIEILKRFADLVVDELELRQVAQRDYLTGVMSRRAFGNEVDRLIGLNNRDGRGSALIMFDIDHFKLVNDRLGHLAGDQVLKEIAGRVSTVLRVEDRIGRIGGEEFAVLAAGTDPEDALTIAERLRVALAVSPVHLAPIHLGPTPLGPTQPGMPISVTASFGVAALAIDMDSARWFAAADAALYRAKNEGRNRCVLAAQPAFTERRRAS